MSDLCIRLGWHFYPLGGQRYCHWIENRIISENSTNKHRWIKNTFIWQRKCTGLKSIEQNPTQNTTLTAHYWLLAHQGWGSGGRGREYLAMGRKIELFMNNHQVSTHARFQVNPMKTFWCGTPGRLGSDNRTDADQRFIPFRLRRRAQYTYYGIWWLS